MKDLTKVLANGKALLGIIVLIVGMGTWVGTIQVSIAEKADDEVVAGMQSDIEHLKDGQKEMKGDIKDVQKEQIEQTKILGKILGKLENN